MGAQLATMHHAACLLIKSTGVDADVYVLCCCCCCCCCRSRSFSQAGSSCGTPQTAAASPGTPMHTRCRIPWQWRHLTATHLTQLVRYEQRLVYDTSTFMRVHICPHCVFAAGVLSCLVEARIRYVIGMCLWSCLTCGAVAHAYCAFHCLVRGASSKQHTALQSCPVGTACCAWRAILA
jgi:hypothetical protein